MNSQVTRRDVEYQLAVFLYDVSNIAFSAFQNISYS